MASRSRQKGNRAEREIVDLHRELGIEAQRVPLSGSAGGRFAGDVQVYPFGSDAPPISGEVKARGQGQGFATISRWLGNNDVLYLRQDRAAPFMVVPWRTWEKLLAAIPRKTA